MTLEAANALVEVTRYTLNLLNRNCPDLLDESRAAHDAAVAAARANLRAAMQARQAARKQAQPVQTQDEYVQTVARLCSIGAAAGADCSPDSSPAARGCSVPAVRASWRAAT